ncbi:MAG: DUF4412 domain-containing protein [Candidatus Diapherotrites archaeon]|nr:DUF4412 domain-containing protein [Candidatus Diapherotrites archaeon]
MKKILFALLVVGILVFGCAQTPPATGNSNTQTPPANPSANPPANTTPQASNPPAGVSLTDLFAAQNAAAFQVTYNFTATSASGNTSGTMTQYYKSQKMRTDLTTQAEGQNVESRIIVTGESTYACSQLEGAWNCLKTTTPNTATQGTQDIQAHPNDYTVTPDGTKTVAGYETTCYKAQRNGETARVRFCYTSDGKPLYIKGEDNGEVSEFTATVVSTSVTDADFELPAQPTAMPGLPDGYTIPGYS